MPRILTSVVSNRAPGAVKRACASCSGIAGQFLRMPFIARLSITIAMAIEAGFSEDRLARIPRFLESQVDAGLLPGAMTLIWRHGRMAHRSMVGEIDMARGKAMRHDAIFRLYSMTKPVTAVALLMLMEEGRIALDDPVKRFIPQFANLTLEGGGAPARDMTVLDLLRHTAGFTYGFHHRTAID